LFRIGKKETKNKVRARLIKQPAAGCMEIYSQFTATYII
jgi:hypothetical protein